MSIQSELARLLPSLTTIQDAYGNTLLISTDLLEKELDLLNRLSTARAVDELENLDKSIRKAKDSAEVYARVDVVGTGSALVKQYFESFDEISKRMDEGTISAKEAQSAYDALSEIMSDNAEIFFEYSDALTIAKFGTLDIGEANRELIGTFNNLVLSEELLITNLDGVSSAFDKFTTDVKNGVNATDAMTSAFDQLGFSYEKFIDKVSEVEEIDPFTSTELNDFKIFNNVMQDLFTEDNIKATNKALDIIKLYGNAVQLTTTQQNEYNRALGFLSDMFPQLNGNIEDNIDVVKAFADTWTLAAENQDAYVEAVSAGIIPVTQETADAITESIEALKKQREEMIKNIIVMEGLRDPDIDISDIESAKLALDELIERINGLEDVQVDIKVMDIENLMTSSEIIQGIIDMQDESSENFIDNLEAEKDAFSDLIDHQLSELDRLEESMRFEDTISELTEDRLSLESQIARLQGDNSIEGISKRKDLEEELAKLKEDLDDEFQDREFELRKQNLESIQSLIENEYDLKIEKEKELNEIIKERIEAQSKALKDDVAALQILQEILLSGEGLGISTFLESLKDTGFFDFSGIDPTMDDQIGATAGAGGTTIVVESVIINGGATEQDGEAFGEGLSDFALANGIGISIIK